MSRIGDLLEDVRVRYARAARMANDLHRRLEAIDAERADWAEAAGHPDTAARARLELKEIDHLRPRLERSIHSWTERARALELIVAACLSSPPPQRPVALPLGPRTPQPRTLLGAPPPPVVWPDAGPGVHETNSSGHPS